MISPDPSLVGLDSMTARSLRALWLALEGEFTESRTGWAAADASPVMQATIGSLLARQLIAMTGRRPGRTARLTSYGRRYALGSLDLISKAARAAFDASCARAVDRYGHGSPEHCAMIDLARADYERAMAGLLRNHREFTAIRQDLAS